MAENPNSNAGAERQTRPETVTLPTTRRALTTGFSPAATASSAADRGEWNIAFNRYQEARQKCEAYDAVYDPLSKRLQVAEDAVPHIVLRPDPYSGRKSPVSTADTEFVRRARWTVANIEAGKCRFDDLPGLQQHLQLCRDMADAADRRDAELERISEKLGYTFAANRMDELADSYCDARVGLMNTPAPDLAALRWKLDQFRDDDGDLVAWTADIAAQTFDDIARLLPRSDEPV